MSQAKPPSRRFAASVAAVCLAVVVARFAYHHPVDALLLAVGFSFFAFVKASE
jgi:hypothetical protein